MTFDECRRIRSQAEWRDVRWIVRDETLIACLVAAADSGRVSYRRARLLHDRHISSRFKVEFRVVSHVATSARASDSTIKRRNSDDIFVIAHAGKHEMGQ